MKTEWDYTERASTYDKRADYSGESVTELLHHIGAQGGDVVADIGAGTGKLTKQLLQNQLIVHAIEPNDQMRARGERNSFNEQVTWIDAVGEHTSLESNSVSAAFYGSSFNVLNQDLALTEAFRILRPGGWFCCMWNHRDLDDLVQKNIEQVIHNIIPDYDYGSRRQDPSDIILKSGLYSEVRTIQKVFTVTMMREDIVAAWRSHDTLYRQSSGRFEEIISAIEDLLTNVKYTVPYFTRIWYAQALVNK